MIVCMGYFIINDTCVMEYEFGTICHIISRWAGCLLVWNPHHLCKLLSNRTFDRDKSISIMGTFVQLPRRQERTESGLTFPARETGMETLWLAAFPSGWLPSYVVRSSLLACRTAIWGLSPD